MTETTARSPRCPPGLAAAALVAAVIAVYWPVRNYPFVNFDDNIYVSHNPRVLGGLTLENVRWAFDGFHENFWQPLVWLSLMLDCSLFGPGPGGFHATNVLLHAANAVLLWLALRQMTGAAGRSFAVAALWALHPLRVESVAWITERKDTLSGFCWFLTLLAYAHYATRPNRRRYAGVLAAFALGLLAKPILVTLPLVLLALDAWPLRRLRTVADAKSLGLEKAPLLALSALAAVAAVLAQDAEGSIPTLRTIPLDLRLATTVRAVTRYLGATFLPVKLGVFYPYDDHPPLATVLGAAAVISAITLAAVWLRRRRPALACGWAWFLIALAPVCGLVQIGASAAADRYTYLPGVGLTLAAVWLAADAFPRGGRWLALGAAVALAWGSSRQVTHWRSSRALFERALAVTSGNWLAHYNVGHSLLQAGDLAAAQAQFTAAVRLKPAYAQAHGALAYTLRARGDADGARAEYLAAARAATGDAPLRYNLGSALFDASDFENAARAFRCAARLDPAMAVARESLGNALLALDRPAEAVAEFQGALRLDPANPRLPARLEAAREQLGAPAP